MAKTPPLEIRRSRIQGLGAFATRRIKKGERVIEYTGEVIDDAEADRRYDDEGMKRHHTFLFSVEEDLNIDGDSGGNDARFINHSCAPNCEAVDEDSRIFIHAKRTIEAGTELSYDYGYQLEVDPEDTETIARYVCRCGAETCRGTILKPKKKKKKKAKKAKKAKAE